MKKLPDCYGIIPARYNSRRFPGKPLADILGRPMIWHVYTQAVKCPLLERVIVATDDDRILSALQDLGIPALMTRPDHPSGTDRVLEAARWLALSSEAVLVNIQGDEPALEPAMLTQLIRPFADSQTQVTTLACEIDQREAEIPDQVKVVFSGNGRALYFSRSPIPFHRDAWQNGLPENIPKVKEERIDRVFKHIGLYAYTRPFLLEFTQLLPTPL